MSHGASRTSRPSPSPAGMPAWLARRIGELDGYTVSDILVHRGARRFAAQQTVLSTPWDIFADHTDVDACGAVGLHAMYYGLGIACNSRAAAAG
jgi:hypothetical protein